MKVEMPICCPQKFIENSGAYTCWLGPVQIDTFSASLTEPNTRAYRSIDRNGLSAAERGIKRPRLLRND